MAVAAEVDAGLGIEEVVLDIDVEHVLARSAVAVVDVLVVIAVRPVTDVAELQVAENAPGIGQRIGGLHEGAGVQFGGVGVIVAVAEPALLVEDGRIQAHQLLQGSAGIGQVTEMVALELLHGQAADDVPGALPVADVRHDAVRILAQALLAHEVAVLDLVAGRVREIGNAVTVRVVRRDGEFPVLVDVPGEVQDVVGLPEVVGGAGPERAVVHPVAVHRIIRAVDGHQLVEGVVLSQAGLPHIPVGQDAGLLPVGPVHDGEVVVAGRHAVPGLAGVLEIAEELVGEFPAASQPGQAAIVRARAAVGPVQVAVSRGLVIGAFEDEVVPEQPRGDAAAPVEGVPGAVGSADFGRRDQRGGLGAQGEVTAERQVEIQSHTTRKLSDVVAFHDAIDVSDGGVGIP